MKLASSLALVILLSSALTSTSFSADKSDGPGNIDKPIIVRDQGEIKVEKNETIIWSYKDERTKNLSPVTSVYTRKDKTSYQVSFEGKLGTLEPKEIYSQKPGLCYESESKNKKVCIGDKVMGFGNTFDNATVMTVIGIQAVPSGLFSKKRHVFLETHSGNYGVVDLDSIELIQE